MKGMVTAPQPLAVEEGILVLKRGGNAVDAAITTAFVQGVVTPQSCGIAGFGTMYIYMGGEHRFIDFHGTAPSKATPEMWKDIIISETRDGFGYILEGKVNDVGYQSIAVPGTLKGCFEALSRYGTISWEGAIGPAIRYAEEGFPVSTNLWQSWGSHSLRGQASSVERLNATDEARKIYFKENGDLYGEGEIFTNKDMAGTLKRIAQEGPDLFYKGEMARQMVADIESHGGFLTLEDLANYQVTVNQPLWGSYRGHKVATNQPPGGGITLLEILNILEEFDLASLGHNSPEYIRVVAEAMK
ncbi:MAG: gamma-glutamyltransferase, partial [Candidatus Tectomicrobia bacterium]|nr:gamma-glutamyltransferase [Candidatus Tectomicrobia bacterium]